YAYERFEVRRGTIFALRYYREADEDIQKTPSLTLPPWRRQWFLQPSGRPASPVERGPSPPALGPDGCLYYPVPEGLTVYDPDTERRTSPRLWIDGGEGARPLAPGGGRIASLVVGAGGEMGAVLEGGELMSLHRQTDGLEAVLRPTP